MPDRATRLVLRSCVLGTDVCQNLAPVPPGERPAGARALSDKMGTMRFSQVDVFSAEPLLGNPVAVVHDADGLSDEQMAAFARWTNLSETTFLLHPDGPGADYRLRIWTPGGELPFAGHPTLGSAHAWLEAGGVPAGDDLVQECGAGLVRVRRGDGERLAFAAPPLTRSGPVDADDVAGICRRAAARRGRRRRRRPGSTTGRAGSACCCATPHAVLALEPDWAAFGDLKIGVVGPYADGAARRRGARVLPGLRDRRRTR